MSSYTQVYRFLYKSISKRTVNFRECKFKQSFTLNYNIQNYRESLIYSTKSSYHSPKSSTHSTFNEKQRSRFQAVGVTGAIFLLAALAFRKSVILNEPEQSLERVEPVTKVAFSTKLALPEEVNHEASFELVGYGVRTVTFLRFTAYAVAIYFDATDLAKLEKSHWKDSFSSEKFLSDPLYADEFIADLIKRDIKMALSIVPVKATSGAHLKGGLTRNLENHLSYQTSKKLLTPEQASKIKEAIQDFGHAFPKGTLPVFSQLLFIRMTSTMTSTPTKGKSIQRLRIIDQGVDKGTIDHPWLGDTLLKAYLNGNWVVSNELRQSFAEMMQERLHPLT